MKLIDSALDLGLFSDNPAMPSWYSDELGAPPVEVIQHSPTYAERFYRLGGSCLKINHSTEPMPAGSSGYKELVVARAGIHQPVTRRDPDGLHITLVPEHDLDGAELAIRMEVADPARQREFFEDALGAVPAGDGVRLGDALFRFCADPSASRPAPTWSRGFKYYVLFVEDTPAAHAELVAAGAEHGLRPLRLGDRCVFSWLRDPSGNWFELVQRATPGRPLADVDLAGDCWDEIVEWRTAGTPA